MTYGVQPGSLPSMTYTGDAKLRLPLGGGLDLGFPMGFSVVDRGLGGRVRLRPGPVSWRARG